MVVEIKSKSKVVLINWLDYTKERFWFLGELQENSGIGSARSEAISVSPDGY